MFSPWNKPRCFYKFLALKCFLVISPGLYFPKGEHHTIFQVYEEKMFKPSVCFRTNWHACTHTHTYADGLYLWKIKIVICGVGSDDSLVRRTERPSCEGVSCCFVPLCCFCARQGVFLLERGKILFPENGLAAGGREWRQFRVEVAFQGLPACWPFLKAFWLLAVLFSLVSLWHAGYFTPGL